jgi:hypothetical protein
VSEPRRLREEWNDERARAVLDAASRDVPAPGAQARAARAAVAALSMAGPPTTDPPSASGGGSGSGGAGVTRLSRALVFGGGAGFFAVVAVVYFASADRSAAAPVGTAWVSSAIPTAAPSASSLSVLEPEPSIALVPTMSAPSGPALRPVPTASTLAAAPRASADSASSLAAELASLERARAALAAGRATDALALLDDHAARFPRGVLSTEAVVLRIDALLRAGRRANADALARQFLAANPTSPYAPRVRSLIGENGAP